MGRSRFLAMLLICVVLSLSLHQGCGRRVKVLRHYGRWHSPRSFLLENPGVEREMVEMEMDYKDPGANTNPKTGALLNPPTSPPPRN